MLKPNYMKTPCTYKASSFAKSSLNFRLETSNHVGLAANWNWTSLDIYLLVADKWIARPTIQNWKVDTRPRCTFQKPKELRVHTHTAHDGKKFRSGFIFVKYLSRLSGYTYFSVSGTSTLWQIPQAVLYSILILETFLTLKGIFESRGALSKPKVQFHFTSKLLEDGTKHLAM